MHSIMVNNYIPELYYIKEWSLKHHKWPKIKHKMFPNFLNYQNNLGSETSHALPLLSVFQIKLLTPDICK